MRSLTILLSLIALNAQSSVKNIKNEIAKEFKSARYQSTLDWIKKLPQSEQNDASITYVRGLSHFYRQEYKLASEYFQKTVGKRNHPAETHYFYAQSLLAEGKKSAAKEQFRSSYRSNYKQDYSEYYTHYVEKDINEIPKALRGFKTMSEKEQYDLDIRQPARYEHARILLEQLKKNKTVSKDEALKVYKDLKLAYNINPDSELAPAIEKDFFRLDSEYRLEQETFANGQRKPSKNIYLNFSEYYYYDTNVATLSDSAATSQPTDVDTYVSNTYLTGSYRFYPTQNLTIQPILDFTYLKHTNTDNSTVFSNDSAITNFTISNTYRHKFLNKPSSLLFDVGYNNTQRDRNGEKKLVTYGNTASIGVGENLKYFDIGFTTIRYKFSSFSAYIDSLNNVSHNVSVVQYWNRANKQRVIFMGNVTVTDSETDTSDTNQYGLSTSYVVPELFPKYDFTFGFTLSALDPINTRDQRGVETLYNPNIKVVRNFKKLFGGHDLFLSGIYSYKQNNSKDTENYSYTRHEVGLKTELYF